jgi:DNA-binding ferritin-like protein
VNWAYWQMKDEHERLRADLRAFIEEARGHIDYPMDERDEVANNILSTIANRLEKLLDKPPSERVD